MNKVAYASPFVPVEWIAAHRLDPVWMHRLVKTTLPSSLARRGVCHYADAVVEQVLWGSEVAAVVLTTGCDQMRYAAAYLQQACTVPIFLFNIPSTWVGKAVAAFYREELLRLGRFLESLGGRAPRKGELQASMRRYDAAREMARRRWPGVGAGHDMAPEEYGRWLAALRDRGEAWPRSEEDFTSPSSRVPLALVGGPLLESDLVLFEWVAEAGGRVVLDASEWGERTLPAAVDENQLEADALGELVRVYFEKIPDVFRRPNTRLYEWLERELKARGVRGILFWRRLSCDLWHAELEPMRQRSSVPLLDMEAVDTGALAAARTKGRVEAFLEMLM